MSSAVELKECLDSGLLEKLGERLVEKVFIEDIVEFLVVTAPDELKPAIRVYFYHIINTQGIAEFMRNIHEDMKVNLDDQKYNSALSDIPEERLKEAKAMAEKMSETIGPL